MNTRKEFFLSHKVSFLIIGIMLNIPGLWLDVQEPDGALYAVLAKHIILHQDWLNLFGDGHDWLDKPHFPFWMAAIGYKLFGISSFGYKIPAFIFWLGGIAYTFLIARDLFSKPVAWLSALIYVTALHSTLANFDVRAEPYLTTCIVAAVWHMLNASRGSWVHLVAAAIFAAFAVMTKGIFVLATIGTGWVIYWVIAKQWHEFINYRWWLLVALCFVFMLPELYALYVQFDMHPEKVVFGRTNVSGLRFFFWDSQFGRFFNTGPIKGTGTPGFFLHTTLWAFLPWSTALVTGIIYLLRFDRQNDARRWIIYGGTLITFFLFSFSGFQLPHYIVILFPYFSMIGAYFLWEQRASAGIKVLDIIQSIVLLATGAAIVWLVYLIDLRMKIPIVVGTVLIVSAGFLIRRKSFLDSFLIKGYAIAMATYLFLFLFFYPFLLTYQAGTQAARQIPASSSHVPAGIFGVLSYSFEFDAPQDVELIRNGEHLARFLKRKPCYLFTSKTVADSLLGSGVQASVKAELPYYHTTKLKINFLDHRTRSDAVEPRSLLYIF